MLRGSHNLAYSGHGVRTYGLKPVLERARGYWEFQWILTGTPRFTLANRNDQLMAAPTLCVAPPDSPHGWVDDINRHCMIAVLHFRALPPEITALISPGKPQAINLTPDQDKQHRELLDQVWAMQVARHPGLGLKLDQVVNEVGLLLLDRQQPSPPTTDTRDRVAHALHWFEENISEHPDAQTVARAVGVSAAHLRRVFAQAGRSSPRLELARLRMRAAQRGLLAGWSQEKLATYLGYSDVSAFSRAFKKIHKASPTNWLKNNHKPFRDDL